jgi:hypothetical protein
MFFLRPPHAGLETEKGNRTAMREGEAMAATGEKLKSH